MIEQAKRSDTGEVDLSEDFPPTQRRSHPFFADTCATSKQPHKESEHEQKTPQVHTALQCTFIVFQFGEATLSQAARSGPIVIVFMDSSAGTSMKYLDNFVDSLGVTDHTMIAADDAFRSGALEVTAPIRDHPI